jgi:hypothetical protein
MVAFWRKKYVVVHKSIWLQTVVYIRIINQLTISVSGVVKFSSAAILMSHWRHTMVDGSFWISYYWLRLFRKASCLQLIQNLAPSTTVWEQHDIQIDIKILHAFFSLGILEKPSLDNFDSLFSNSENVEVQLGTTQTWWTFSLSSTSRVGHSITQQTLFFE